MRAWAIAALASAGIAAITLGACGGNGGGEAGVRDDPEAVVRAFYEARADCGRDAAERIYDLTTNATRETREEFVARQLRDERRNGCRPRRPPKVSTFVVDRRGETATIDVRLSDQPEGARRGRVRLLHTDEGWKLDTGGGG
jgi:hypothetical protein